MIWDNMYVDNLQIFLTGILIQDDLFSHLRYFIQIS